MHRVWMLDRGVSPLPTLYDWHGDALVSDGSRRYYIPFPQWTHTLTIPRPSAQCPLLLVLLFMISRNEAVARSDTV